MTAPLSVNQVLAFNYGATARRRIDSTSSVLKRAAMTPSKARPQNSMHFIAP
jgi:hypothetical protein